MLTGVVERLRRRGLRLGVSAAGVHRAVFLGLVVIAPLLAASIVGRRLTGAYGLEAVVAAVGSTFR